jgi:hypothetical protein
VDRDSLSQGALDSALDQARLLADYLMCQSPHTVDVRFVRTHAESLVEFANEARRVEPEVLRSDLPELVSV